ncbi:hypothetical protein JCGZ_00414 [Jatropha curcas]|uniref:MPN domain-containing protein n=1 Tax=Jatropha curcas TaxID=180498 RepID=A0A067JG62_JATCU|nr:BRCA1-A complex subunit Abraxas 1 [Jatropha curcas]KDP22827.1 hypothetical protein JCGZ_00414 [Jatropha curcas]
MDDLPLQKVAISGPTLASMIQRFSSSLGDVDGLLFGHVNHITPSTLSDDSPQTHSDSGSLQLVATITSFLCPSFPLSFYDSLGRVDSYSLLRLLSAQSHNHFIGWFSGRRRTPIRPSMREFSVSRCLSTNSQFSFPIKNSESPINLTPCVFLLLATPLQDQLIHTHDYRAYQFRVSTLSFDPKPIDIVNIGPAFRGHYESFSPNSPLPMLNCETSSLSAMNEDKDEDSLSELKHVSKDQKELDKCAEGFAVSSLSRLMGSEASNYTAGLENLYEKMLAKIDSLARKVENSNAKVLEQENINRKLRQKVARTGLE